MTYSIHEDNLDKLKSKLNKIEKKCNKYGCNFIYKEIGEEYKDIQHYKEGFDGYKKVEDYTHTTKERFVIVEVEGNAKINNWEFIATLEHTELGNIIRSYNKEIEVSESYRYCKPTCEHCNTNRSRKDTYIIRNTVNGEFKQVGKSCLMDYTNGLSAEMIASYLSYFNALQKMDDMESIGGGYGCNKNYINVASYLSSAVEVVNKLGFVSKSVAEQEGKIPTSGIVLKMMNPVNQFDKDEIEKIDFVQDRQENIEIVEKMLEWLSTQDLNNNQYIGNLKIACSKEYAEYRDLGLLASLPSAYYKAINNIAEKERQEKEKEGTEQSEHFGNVGDRIVLDNVTINRIASYSTDFGAMFIYKITSGTNVFIWKTGKYEEMKDGKMQLIEMFTSIKGTIKAHTKYGDELQTELTRCKVM